MQQSGQSNFENTNFAFNFWCTAIFTMKHDKNSLSNFPSLIVSFFIVGVRFLLKSVDCDFTFLEINAIIAIQSNKNSTNLSLK